MIPEIVTYAKRLYNEARDIAILKGAAQCAANALFPQCGFHTVPRSIALVNGIIFLLAKGEFLLHVFQKRIEESSFMKGQEMNLELQDPCHAQRVDMIQSLHQVEAQSGAPQIAQTPKSHLIGNGRLLVQ